MLHRRSENGRRRSLSSRALAWFGSSHLSLLCLTQLLYGQSKEENKSLLKVFFFFFLNERVLRFLKFLVVLVFVAAHGLPLVAESGGFSCCGAQASGTWVSVAVAQGLIRDMA